MDYELDEMGLIVDEHQGMVCINCSYATEGVPIVKEENMADLNKPKDMNIVYDKSRDIEHTYCALRTGGGNLFRGVAYGEFGVSKSANEGAPAPLNGSALKHPNLLGIPTMGFADEIIMNELQSIRSYNNNSSSTSDTKISVLALLIKACSVTLHEYPVVNSIVHDDSKMELCVKT